MSERTTRSIGLFGAIAAILVTSVWLLPALREQIAPGMGRTLATVVGIPIGWIAAGLVGYFVLTTPLRLIQRALSQRTNA